MPNVQLINHQGHTIVKTTFPPEADLTGLKAVLSETGAAYARFPVGSVLALVEFGEREFDQATIDLMEAVAKANAPIVKATAFLGVTGPQKALFKALISITGRRASLHSNQKQALEWLAEADADEDPLAGL